MNPEAQAVLDEILKKNPKDLNVDEIGFLRARRSYLKDSQLKEYDSVLETKPSETKPVKQKNANSK